MHPGSAIGRTHKVGMIILDNEVVDFVAFGTTMPLDGSHDQRRSGSCDYGIADCQSTRRHKTLPSYIEGMLASGADRLYDFVRLRIRHRYRYHHFSLFDGRPKNTLDI